ncbi:MAG TPA: hypothetical protein VGN00_25915 [Puia sp.]|jgi:hypothetical protein
MKTKVDNRSGELYEEPWGRWWNLVKLYWIENSRQNILSLLAIGGLMLLLFCFSFLDGTNRAMNPGFQAMIYFVGLFFVGCLYGSLVFSELNRKREAIQYLLLPASHAEKLFCGLFFSVLLFFLVYNALFYLVDIPMVKLANSITWKTHLRSEEPLSNYSPKEVFSPMDFKGKHGGGSTNELVIFLLSYFAIQSAYILGSVYFTRYNFIKTTITLLLLGFAGFLFFNNVIDKSLPPGVGMKGLFRWGYYDMNTKESQWVLLPSGVETILLFVIKWSWPFLLWFATFLRLKEKQVQG